MNDVTAYLTDLGLRDISDRELKTAADCSQYIPELNRNPDEKFYEYFYSSQVPESALTWSDIQDRHNWDFKHQLLPTMKAWAMSNWPTSPGTVLDGGCGSGLDLCYLARSFPHKRFVGLDSSAPAQVHLEKRARQLGLANVRGQIGDAFALRSLPHGIRGDAIVLNNILDSFFPNEPAVNRRLKAVRNLLQPSGTLFLSLSPSRTPEDTLVNCLKSAARRAGFSIEGQGSFEYSQGPRNVRHLWWTLRALDHPPGKWWQFWVR